MSVSFKVEEIVQFAEEIVQSLESSSRVKASLGGKYYQELVSKIEKLSAFFSNITIKHIVNIPRWNNLIDIKAKFIFSIEHLFDRMTSDAVRELIDKEEPIENLKNILPKYTASFPKEL